MTVPFPQDPTTGEATPPPVAPEAGVAQDTAMDAAMDSAVDAAAGADTAGADTGIAWEFVLRTTPDEPHLLQSLGWPPLLSDLIYIAIIIALALGTYRVLRIFTSRLQREIDEPDLVRKRLREQRAQTVASLLNNIGLVVLSVLALLMILNTFINIGPLLAGVGVFGLAVSFGAQSLVKDLISGGFMLVEGQFAVGDVIRVGDTAGTVEKITLRTIVLRDVNGIVHVIPNGSVEILSNLTKGWSRAVLEIGVAYKEDVDQVMEVMLDEAMKLYHDPDWHALIVEEPVVPGIERFDDSAVTIRVMFKTLPLKQWDVARMYRRRIKKRFDMEDIEIPFPHRTVYWGVGENPGAPGGADGARIRGEGEG